jgi:hypothetical protein
MRKVPIAPSVLVVGGGIAVGVLQLLGDDSGKQQSAQTSGGGSGEGGQKAPAPVVRPGDVSVAVFNGTLIPGLAKETGDKIEALGFDRNSVGQAPPEGQKAESVVFYAPGKKREAQFVRKKLKTVNVTISNIEAIDDVFKPLQGTADVVVVVGANATN